MKKWIAAVALVLACCLNSGAENLIRNGGFELDDMSPFQFYRLDARTYKDISKECSESFSEANFSAGKRSLEIKSTCVAASHNLRIPGLPAKGGAVYRLSFKVFLADDTAVKSHVSGLVWFQDQDDKDIPGAEYYLPNTFDGAKGKWVEVRLQFRAPKNAAATRIKILSNGAIHCFLDELELTEVK